MPDDPSTPPSSERRRAWEARWQDPKGTELAWHIEEAPEELRRLLEDEPLPSGPALDLGCGSGVVTAFLATRFPRAVGIDIAHGAVREARSRAAGEGARPLFSVADASRLPFAGGAFAFAFDRGCLQNMPRELWPAYFAEVERLLVPSGVLQLFCSKAERVVAPLLSRKGVKQRVKAAFGRRPGPQFLSPDLIRELTPATLETLTLEEFPYRTSRGGLRRMTYGVFRRR